MLYFGWQKKTNQGLVFDSVHILSLEAAVNTAEKFSIVMVRSVALIFYTARVLLYFWGWFLLPLGAPPITYLYAVGIVLTGSLFYPTDYKRQWENKKGEQFWIAVLNRFAFVTTLLVIGWFCHLFLK